MTFPPTREPVTPEDFLNRLPAGLRTFVERELAAGNAIAETGTGFPAAPVGVWLRLARYFLTSTSELPEDVVFRERPQWTWPAECTDPPRHFFILAGEKPPPPVEPRSKPVLHIARNAPPPPPPRPADAQVTPAIPFAYADEFDREGLAHRVSEAIGQHLGLMWNEETEKAIRAAVGDEGLALAREVDAFANRADFWQNARSLDRAYEQVQRDLGNKYPWLSASAIQRLATRAAWGWK